MPGLCILGLFVFLSVKDILKMYAPYYFPEWMQQKDEMYTLSIYSDQIPEEIVTVTDLINPIHIL